jgi:hypothetical protein
MRPSKPLGASRQLLRGTAAAALVAGLAYGAARASVAMTPYENSEFLFSVALPGGCRHAEGPGTVEAVCAAELDPDKSAVASAAASLVLEVGAEAKPDDRGKPPSVLAEQYGDTQFKEELPEAICGESDRARVKIEQVKRVLEDTRVVYTADVACSEIKFLGLGERRATVRVVITQGVRYRLMARALKDDFEKQKETVEAFLASFRLLPGEKKNP